MVMVAVVGLIAAAATWIHSGGPEATPAGVLSIALGVFGYFPVLYYSSTGTGHPMLPTATMHLFAVHMATIALTTFAPAWPQSPLWAGQGIPRGEGRWLFSYGLLLLAGGAFGTIQLGLPSTALPAALGFVGVTLMTYATTFTSHNLRKRSVVVAVGSVAVYMSLLFNTGGRLVIAGLAFTIMLFLTQRARRRSLKVFLLASLAPSLLLAARQRSESVQAARGIEETGLESVVWPMDRLAILLQISDRGGSLLLGAILSFPQSCSGSLEGSGRISQWASALSSCPWFVLDTRARRATPKPRRLSESGFGTSGLQASSCSHWLRPCSWLCSRSGVGRLPWRNQPLG